MITIERTKLAYRVSLAFQHHDECGSILQTYNQEEWQACRLLSSLPWLPETFKQENVIVEYENTIRGLHGDALAWKLITCLLGRIRLALVNPDTLVKEIFDVNIITGDDTYQILVPPRILHGQSVRSRMAVIHYLWSEKCSRIQETLRYDDERLAIDWGITGKPTLSARDWLNEEIKL